MPARSAIPKKCLFVGCDRTVTSLGLCQSHRRQQLAGLELSEIKIYSNKRTNLECLIEWCDRAVYQTGLCNRHYQVIRTHGLTVESYSNLMKNRECMACGAKENLHIDHDHSCCANVGGRTGGVGCGRCVRGVLCVNCNAALGHLKDSTDRVYKLLKYMERF